jgi:superoxide dismutase, Fe-Mn family
MYNKKDYSHLIGTPGFSDELLQNHFTLYEGYVTNTNKLVELLDTQEFSTPEYAEIQRRLGWEWNGMRLHEQYFENMQPTTTEGPSGEVEALIEKVYGSVEKWQSKFTNIGTMRGIGWVVLFYDQESGELFSSWVNEHDMGILAGCKILLVMDVFEHAFMVDYGLKRADYIKNFFSHINWTAVNNRLTL